MIAFIDEHRDQFFGRGHLPHPACDSVWVHHLPRLPRREDTARFRARGAILTEEIRRVHAENYRVYGVRKMHHEMRRAGWKIGRDQAARLMRAAGLEGVRRGRKPVTTKPAREPDARPDLVERRFAAERPNQS